jgi:hypothetical protein
VEFLLAPKALVEPFDSTCPYLLEVLLAVRRATLLELQKNAIRITVHDYLIGLFIIIEI